MRLPEFCLEFKTLEKWGVTWWGVTSGQANRANIESKDSIVPMHAVFKNIFFIELSDISWGELIDIRWMIILSRRRFFANWKLNHQETICCHFKHFQKSGSLPPFFNSWPELISLPNSFPHLKQPMINLMLIDFLNQFPAASAFTERGRVRCWEGGASKQIWGGQIS